MAITLGLYWALLQMGLSETWQFHAVPFLMVGLASGAENLSLNTTDARNWSIAKSFVNILFVFVSMLTPTKFESLENNIEWVSVLLP